MTERKIRDHLIKLETELEPLLDKSLRAGQILREIRDEKLYFLGYATFDEYCEKKWKFTRQRAYGLIRFAEISENLGVNHGLQNERQARELARIKTPGGQKQAYLKAMDLADERGVASPTTRDYKKSVDEVLGNSIGKTETPSTFNELKSLFLKLSDDDKARFIQWARDNMKDSPGVTPNGAFAPMNGSHSTMHRGKRY